MHISIEDSGPEEGMGLKDLRQAFLGLGHDPEAMTELLATYVDLGQAQRVLRAMVDLYLAEMANRAGANPGRTIVTVEVSHV